MTKLDFTKSDRKPRMTLNVSLGGKTAGQIQGIADKNKTTVSRVIRMILEEYLSK